MRTPGLIAAILIGTVITAAAGDYPDHPLQFIVPQAAGSATDTVARILGAELSKDLGQQVIVDDRPGGALTIGPRSGRKITARWLHHRYGAHWCARHYAAHGGKAALQH